MREVADLDAQLRRATEQREDAIAENATLVQERQDHESTSDVVERLRSSMEAQVAMVRAERDAQAKQHAADKEFLNGIFTQLEAQLALARTEREETHARAERERRAASKRAKELEESAAEARSAKERMREQCEREKEVLSKQFEQRVAGLRLEKESSRIDKGVLRRLEKELAELKMLSASVLGPLASHASWGAQPGLVHGTPADVPAFADIADPSVAIPAPGTGGFSSPDSSMYGSATRAAGAEY